MDGDTNICIMQEEELFSDEPLCCMLAEISNQQNSSTKIIYPTDNLIISPEKFMIESRQWYQIKYYIHERTGHNVLL